jgi:5-methyltetrahydrofolate--homocysteine methyltransferase
MVKRIQDIIKERILVLDGAMGTMIQSYNLQEEDFRGKFNLFRGQMRGNNDVLCLTRPDVILDIHRRYLKAGADIIETNTFSAQRISEADYGMASHAREMALAGARLARQAADEFSTPEKPRFVAGSVGPTNKTCSMSPDVSNPARRDLTYGQLFEAYLEQMDSLIEGGVDALLIETIFDSLNSKCAIDAAMTAMKQRGVELPIMLSVTVSDLAGRTLSGQTLDAYLASVSTYPIFSIGLNCSFGARQMKPFLRELAKRAPYYISCYPNAGLPNSLGLYDETAETMAPQIGELIDEGLVNIVGGCCGTTDEFIAKYADLVRGTRFEVRGTRTVPEWKKPHVPAPKPQALWLSGLDLLEISHLAPRTSHLEESSHLEVIPQFTNVGERCNVAGSRKFLRLIKEKNYDEAIGIARKQVQDGAMVIDINMDDGLLDAREEMVNFLNLIASEPDIARVPVMIDSSKWDVITAGLQCVQGKSIVNSISLKEGEEVFLSHARDCMRYGAAVVVMCFDEQGQATTYERRIEIASRAYQILTQQVGMNPLDIIFDPNILAIATGMEEHDAYGMDFIRATQWIRENLPGAHVSGGVSNLSFSFRGNNYIREAMHAVFLYHAIQAGMDFGIVNPATKVAYSDIPDDQLEVIEDVVLNRKKGAAERLIEVAGEISKREESSKCENSSSAEGNLAPRTSHLAPRDIPVEERLSEALVKGIGDHLEEDLKDALEKYPRAVDIIEGPLMAGMNRVGVLFGEGKMFLPQVVKTARTMKQAVEILQPYMEKGRQEDKETGRQEDKKAGKVLLATVKGDVHDIGKNIVSVVMACNGYEVIDMGVMVPAEQIVQKAKEEKVDMIGLSGLITPSLEEMVNVARELKRAGMNIPIMIGGATTSELHVALKIAPVYGGPVVWMKDASQNALVAARLMNEEQAVEQELNEKYEQLRHDYQQEQVKLVSLEEARAKKPKMFGD